MCNPGNFSIKANKFSKLPILAFHKLLIFITESVSQYRKLNNTIEPEAEFLSEIRPSVVPEAKPRALREV